MRVLVVHHEGRYFGGTEILLGSFLAGLRAAGIDYVVAATRGSRMAGALPPDAEIALLPENERFSAGKFAAQLSTLMRGRNARAFDVVHGWAARDWELVAAVGALMRRPVVGTLHDHPRAAYISTQRQVVMRSAASFGLDRVTCPSKAVLAACVEAGYPVRKLAVVPNGIPLPPAVERTTAPRRMRLGFLGVFSEGKGLSGLFEMLDLLEQSRPDAWELHIAGASQTEAGEALIHSIRSRYESSAWWHRVEWSGWTEDRSAFLRDIDVLVCPFTQFEAFGLVVCEAGAARVPVVSTRIGAIPEIVEDGRTGWLFTPGDWQTGAAILANLVTDAPKRIVAGDAARARVAEKFEISAMVRSFANLYAGLA